MRTGWRGHKKKRKKITCQVPGKSYKMKEMKKKRSNKACRLCDEYQLQQETMLLTLILLHLNLPHQLTLCIS